MKTEIAVITRDRPDDLYRCLEAICKYSPSISSVIVVDSSIGPQSIESNARTVQVLGEKIKIKYFHYQMNFGTLPQARNYALMHAKEEFLMFIDDDAFINESTMDALLTLILKIEDLHVFGCRILQGNEISHQCAVRKNLIPEYNLIRWTSGNFNITGSGFIKVEHMQGTCMCFRRKSLLLAGGFNENLCSGYASFEDTEATTRVSRLFHTPVYLTLDGNLVHGISPRLNGMPRDLGLSKTFAHSFARNGTITSILHFGRFKTIMCFLIVSIYNSLKIVKPFIKDFNFNRFLCVLYFVMGQMQGIKDADAGLRAINRNDANSTIKL